MNIQPNDPNSFAEQATKAAEYRDSLAAFEPFDPSKFGFTIKDLQALNDQQAGLRHAMKDFQWANQLGLDAVREAAKFQRQETDLCNDLKNCVSKLPGVDDLKRIQSDYHKISSFVAEQDWLKNQLRSASEANKAYNSVVIDNWTNKFFDSLDQNFATKISFDDCTKISFDTNVVLAAEAIKTWGKQPLPATDFAADSFKKWHSAVVGNGLISEQMQTMADMTKPVSDQTQIIEPLHSVVEKRAKISEKVYSLSAQELFTAKNLDFDINDATLPASFFTLADMSLIHEQSFEAIELEIKNITDMYWGTVESTEPWVRRTLRGVQHRLRVCREIIFQYWNGPISSYATEESAAAMVDDLLFVQSNIQEMKKSIDKLQDDIFDSLD